MEYSNDRFSNALMKAAMAPELSLDDTPSISTPKVEYTLNILDIIAITIAILAVLISIFIAYRTDHISSNTDQSTAYLSDIHDVIVNNPSALSNLQVP